MRPVDFQAPLLQSHNVERQGQQEISQQQVAQQAFAQQLSKTAGDRPTQVQAPIAVQGGHPAEIRREERGERPDRERDERRRQQRLARDARRVRAYKLPPGGTKSEIDLII